MCKRAWRASVGVCGALSQVVVHLRLSIKPVSRDQSARSFLLTESRCVVCVRRVWAGGGRGGCWRRRRTDLAWVVGSSVGSRSSTDRPARRGILKDGHALNKHDARGGPWAKGAPSEDHTPYGRPSSRSTAAIGLLGGRPRMGPLFRGWPRPFVWGRVLARRLIRRLKQTASLARALVTRRSCVRRPRPDGNKAPQQRAP